MFSETVSHLHMVLFIFVFFRATDQNCLKCFYIFARTSPTFWKLLSPCDPLPLKRSLLTLWLLQQRLFRIRWIFDRLRPIRNDFKQNRVMIPFIAIQNKIQLWLKIFHNQTTRKAPTNKYFSSNSLLDGFTIEGKKVKAILRLFSVFLLFLGQALREYNACTGIIQSLTRFPRFL